MANNGAIAERAMRPLVTGLKLSNQGALPEVLARLQPTDEGSLADWLHAVHLFGPEAAVTLSGKHSRILEQVCEGEAMEQHFGGRVLARTRYGLRFPLVHEWVMAHSQANTESHPGQGLAAFATSAVPLDHPVFIPGEQQRYSVADIVSDVAASFVLEGEIYWDVVALAIYLPPQRAWKDKFGKEFTFDQIVEELIKRSPDESSCAGTHGLIALATILRVDREAEILSPGARERLRRHLTDVVGQLRRTQLPDGGWSLRWNESPPTAVSATPLAIPPWDVILATGHHLEWLLLLPEDLQPERAVYETAAEQTLRLLRMQVDHEGVQQNYCPAVHAARSVRLLTQDVSE